jgi:AcrR family transcriptional regulator
MKGLVSRHERRKLRTRRKLLEAARRVIGQRGYDDTSVLDITEAADVSKGTFYLHFKDKEDLTRTLIMQGFEELTTKLDELIGAATPDAAIPNMERTLRVVFGYAGENRDLFRIMLGRQATAELNMMAFTHFSQTVEKTIMRISDSGGPLPNYPPELLAQFIAGAGVRLGLWWVEDDHGLSPADIAHAMYTLLTQGVLAGAPASAPAPAPSDDVTE